MSAVAISTLAVVIPSAPAGASAGPTEVCQVAEPVSATLPVNGTIEASFTFSSSPYVLSNGFNDNNPSDDAWYLLATGQELAATKVYTFVTNVSPISEGAHGSAGVVYVCS
jgi:hypothetical protein